MMHTEQIEAPEQPMWTLNPCTDVFEVWHVYTMIGVAPLVMNETSALVGTRDRVKSAHSSEALRHAKYCKVIAAATVR